MNFINVNGINLHYEFIEGSQEKTFVLVNSLGTDFRIWDGVIKDIKEMGSILRFDKQGHGLSEVANSPYSIGNYAQDVIALISILNLKNIIYIGSSMGGVIGQHIAVHHPKLIQKLILSNTASKVGTIDSWKDRISKIESLGIESISTAVMKVWFSEKFHSVRKEELMGYKTMLSNSNLKGYKSACIALMENDLTDKISEINIPTLCIAGSEDGSTPPALVRSMSNLIPNSSFIEIENVGHIPFVENPSKFIEIIKNFLEE